MLQPKVTSNSVEGTPLGTLLKDPYILLCAGAIAIGNIGMAVLEPTLPIRMLEVMRVDPWQLGEYAEREVERERKPSKKQQQTKQLRTKQTNLKQTTKMK